MPAKTDSSLSCGAGVNALCVPASKIVKNIYNLDEIEAYEALLISKNFHHFSSYHLQDLAPNCCVFHQPFNSPTLKSDISGTYNNDNTPQESTLLWNHYSSYWPMMR